MYFVCKNGSDKKSPCTVVPLLTNPRMGGEHDTLYKQKVPRRGKNAWPFWMKPASTSIFTQGYQGYFIWMIESNTRNKQQFYRL